MSDELQERIARESPLIAAICEALTSGSQRVGFIDDKAVHPDPSALSYHLERDPSSGEMTLVGDWLDVRGHRFGQVLLHGDGSFFAEYDIVRPHPTRPRWFVEAITAWGRDGEIRTDPRLLAALE